MTWTIPDPPPPIEYVGRVQSMKWPEYDMAALYKDGLPMGEVLISHEEGY